MKLICKADLACIRNLGYMVSKNNFHMLKPTVTISYVDTANTVQ